MKDRSTGEIVTFAAAAFGIWLLVWGVLLRSKTLEVTAFLITFFALIAFALRDSD